jgi:hypothetical protein
MAKDAGFTCLDSSGNRNRLEGTSFSHGFNGKCPDTSLSPRDQWGRVPARWCRGGAIASPPRRPRRQTRPGNTPGQQYWTGTAKYAAKYGTGTDSHWTRIGQSAGQARTRLPRDERNSTGQAPTHARGSRLKPGFAIPHRQRSFLLPRRARASDCIGERVRNERCKRDPEIRSISSDIVVSIDGVLGSFLSRGA